MKLSREQRFIAWVLAGVAVAAVSFFVGGALKPAEEQFYLFDTDATAYGDAASIAAVSPGGFTGFGDVDGTDSRTVVGGRVVEVNSAGLTLEAPHGQRTALRFADQPRIERLGAAAVTDLSVGATIAVILSDDEETIVSALVLSAP